MLASRPEPLPQAGVFFSAFRYLTRSRAIGIGGVGAIPVSEILAYCELQGISEAEPRSVMLQMITALDEEWLTTQSPTGEENEPGEHA